MPLQYILPIDPVNQSSDAWFEQHNPEAWAKDRGCLKRGMQAEPTKQYVMLLPCQRAQQVFTNELYKAAAQYSLCVD